MMSIFISMGGRKSIGITHKGDLAIVHSESGNGMEHLLLGKATKEHLSNLQEYLERLKVHAN